LQAFHWIVEVFLKILFLDFYDEEVVLKSDWEELVSLIDKDFSFFVKNKDNLKSNNKKLEIECYKKETGSVLLPKSSPKMETLNSLTYQEGTVRYNDYYSKLISRFDYKTEKAELFSEDLDKMHEVVYLLILSRVGKRLDLRSLHKLHAFAIAYNDIAFICMMPMKGGKSTLLQELLLFPEFKMISDDIPLIDIKGHVRPMPIKIGMEEKSEIKLTVINPEVNIYSMNRSQYGPKKLICLRGIAEKITEPEKVFTKIILAEGFRFNSAETKLIPSSFWSIYWGLFKHGVIGFGLPMIIEYFWEFGFVDFLIKTKIFFLRGGSFFAFCLKSRKYKLIIGNQPNKTAMMIRDFIIEQYGN
jgi:hypothetical protein